MRWSFLIAALLVAAFGVYVLVLPSSIPSQPAANLPVPTPRMPELAQSGSIIGPGQGAWVKRIDRRGRLALRFRASEYTPVDGHDILVKHPEADFFLSDGQILHVIGTTGTIPDPAAGSQQIENLRGMNTEPPSRGVLQDVRIELLPRMGAEPVLSVELPNVAFDDDTSRIYTEGYEDASGRRVEGDQVPITVRGEDYEFDGRGLTVRWSEADNKLQSLEVAHGGRLMIKHPSKFGDFGKHARASDPLAALMLASSDPAAAAEVIDAATTQSGEKDNPHLYRASFDKEVRIFQGNRQVATADVMNVEFLVGESDDEERPATRPATRPRKIATTKPRIRKAKASSSSATEDDPFVIHWTGRLRIEPTEQRDAGMEVGDATVELTGSPVSVWQENATLMGTSLWYRTSDSGLRIEGTPAQPVKIEGADGFSLETGSIRFDRDAKRAVLTGGAARLPVESEKDSQTLAARWSDRCELHFLDGELTMDRAEIYGDVAISHPRLRLTSDALRMQFDGHKSADGKPQLRTIAATGGAVCTLPREGGTDQTLAGDQIALEAATSPDGRLYPRTIAAEGNVRATGGGQEIRAGQLLATLRLAEAATTRPSDQSHNVGAEDLELQSLTLDGGVQITGEDGFAARGDRLDVQDDRIELHGAPAHVSDGESELEGPVVQLLPGEKKAGVLGPGRLRAARAGGDVMEMTWSRDARLDGGRNEARVVGDVRTTLPGASGSVMTAGGGEMVLALADKPQEPEEAEPAATRPSDPRGVQELAEKAAFLRDKQIASVVLRNDVVLHSSSQDEAGNVVLSLDLFAGSIEHDVPTRGVTIPGPGRLLYVDQRTGKEKRADGAGAAPAVRGTTGFEWKGRFAYDDAGQTARMSDGVVIVHEPQGQEGDRYRLEADTVAAELEPSADPQNSSDDLKMSLRRVLAEGNLVLTGPKEMSIAASTIEYDPNTGWLTARGAPEAPVRFTNAEGTTMVEVARVNLETGDLDVKGITGRTR